MQKEYIIAEIKRTTQQNSGIPLGKEKFSKVTGIKQSDWWGKHWRSWGDAVSEAGFSPNSMTEAYSKDFLLSSLAKLTKKLGRIPAEVDLRMERKANASFPSHSTFLNLGEHKDRIRLLDLFFK